MSDTMVRNEEAESRFDELLAEMNTEKAAEREAGLVSLPAILGQYEAIPGHPGFLARAPKLRQQIEIARITDETSAEQTAAGNLEGAAKLARLAIYVSEADETRLATMDEVLDNFDANEISDLLGKYLGLKVQADPGPNAEG